MYEPEATYRDEAKAESRFVQAMHELAESLDRAEKNWEMIAMRLTQFMGDGVPRDETALKAAPPVATSSAVRGLYDLVGRVRDFSDRIARVQERLEL
jgi:hypothetical protein